MSTQVDTVPGSAAAPAAKTTRRGARWTFNTIVATAVLLIMVIPVGVANIYLGFILQESPCTLCGYERFGMVVIATLGVLILRYGPHYKYMASLVLASFFFVYTALRHWGGHIPGDLGQGFGGAMFGVQTYTWALLVFSIVFAAVAAGLIFIARTPSLHKEMSGEVRPVKKFTKYVAVVVAITLPHPDQRFPILDHQRPTTVYRNR
ncbi:disulfide bond formation protein B [Jonesiaceae bacterium BS-20]|uniref:Disulfide bond formation protein B n=1 Tax=Jonesiaceae bacterium BS-20 TaxID=3120821 RepID=A0AAU7DW17_9MICO